METILVDDVSEVVDLPKWMSKIGDCELAVLVNRVGIKGGFHGIRGSGVWVSCVNGWLTKTYHTSPS